MLKDLVQKNRTFRRFREEVPVSMQALEELVDLARLSPSSANRQPLKFILSCDRTTNGRIFPHLNWAGYLTDWLGPAEGERPAAYIAILGDTQVTPSVGCDHGIAVQSIKLGATEMGLGGCIISSIDREALRKALDIPEQYEILLVLALGEPSEMVVIEPLAEQADFEYWRDEEGVHHVPKRSLEELILHRYGV